MSIESMQTTTKTNHFFRALAALALAASLLATARPAEAAFPGKNGNIVFSSNRDGDHEIYRASKCVICKKKLTNNSSEDSYPAVSPDGQKIAFASNRDGNYEVYVMNKDGSNQTRLTNNPGNDFAPAFSPDGKKIAFQSNRDNNFEIYVMNANGSGTPTNLTQDPAYDGSPAFSPDGAKLAFTSGRDGNLEIYVMNALDGSGTPTNLTNHPSDDTSPDFSPDGTRIAFDSTRDFTTQVDNQEIYVMNALDGANPTNLTNNAMPGLGRATDYDPVFSPDGKKISFVSARDGNLEVYSMNANGSDPINLSKTSSTDWHPSWGPKPTQKATR